MPRPHATGSSRLSVDDWIQQGYAIIAEEGLKALKVDRLCERLGVTKGSAARCRDISVADGARPGAAGGEMRDVDHRQFDDLGGIPPRERLSRMMTELVSAHHWMMERAMREWARSDSAVAASMRAADQRLLQAVRQAFLDHGFDPEEADLRASSTVAAGVGFIHLSGPKPSARQAARRERFLDIMLKP